MSMTVTRIGGDFQKFHVIRLDQRDRTGPKTQAIGARPMVL